MNMTDYFFDFDHWSMPWLLTVLLAAVGYLLFLRTKEHQKLMFFGGLALIYFVLGSPFAKLPAFGLHSINMLQHIIMLMVAPILILKSIPARALDGIKLLKNPDRYFMATWALGAIAMWGGHFLSAAQLSSETGLAICGIAYSGNAWWSHIPPNVLLWLLLGVGVLVLMPVLHPNKSRRLAPVESVFYLFSSCLSCSFLGMYVTFSASAETMALAEPVLTTLRSPLIMSRLQDQELAGMLMWVPGCVVYVATSVEILLGWYDAEPIQVNRLKN